MDFLTSLPADLAALADPSVRGAAPLLRPPDSGGETQSPTTPFALCLALLTEPLPGGEAWPGTGKELPLAPLEPAAESAAASATDGLFALAPTALTTAALQASLLPADTALAGAAEAAPGVTLQGRATTPAASVLPPLAGSAPPVDQLAATHPTGLDPLAALAELAADVEPAPLETAAQSAGTQAKAAAAPSWLEAFAEQRLQRPAALTPNEARASAPTSLAAGGAAGFAQSQLTAVAAAPVADLPIAVRRLDLPKLATSAILAGDTASVGQADWWAPAAGTTTTAAALPPASPAAPVDLRSPNWQEAFANRVQWLVDTQVGEARIKLNPPELGAVDVTISLIDDKTYVQLTTATTAARDELSQSLPRLRELFMGSGLELGGASVHSGRDGHASGDGRGTGAAEPRWFAGLAEPGDELAAGRPRRSLGRIDVFA